MLKRVINTILVISFLLCVIGVNAYASGEEIQIKGQLVYKVKDNAGSFFESKYKLSNFPLCLHYFINNQENIVSLTTDREGNFSYTVQEGNVSKAFFVVKAENEACYVAPYTDGQSAPDIKNVYTFKSVEQNNINGCIDFRKVIITPGGAFNITQTIKEGYNFWILRSSATPAKVPIKWSLANVGNKNSFTSPQASFITINGGSDHDETDESVILHEYGHYLMRSNAVGNMYGGKHSIGKLYDARLTYSEGWATYFGQAVLNDPVYVDSWSVLKPSYSIESPGGWCGKKSIGNEIYNSAAMWDVKDEKGSFLHENWDQLEESFKSTADAMLESIHSSSTDSNGIMKATIRDFYDTWIENGNVSKNSADAYNFWRIFYENGMQFDDELPKITVDTTNLGNVTEITNISATVWDNVKVKEVRFIVDGKTKGAVKNPNGTVTFSIDPAKYATGSHNLQIRAYDFAGNYCTTNAGAVSGSKKKFLGIFKTGEQVSESLQVPESVSDDDPSFTDFYESLIAVISNISDSIFTVWRNEYSAKNISFQIGDQVSAKKIATSRAGWDDIGAILDDMDIEHDALTDAQLQDYNILKQYDAVFLNCNDTADSNAPYAKDAIKEYVENGGVLYASDYAYSYVNKVFPNDIVFASNPRYGNSQANVQCIVNDMGIATSLGKSVISINFDLGAWVVIESVPNSTITHVTGTVETYGGIKTVPLLVSFKSGQGKVFYTSFHNEAQITNDMEAILNYLVLNIKNSTVEDNLSGYFEDDNYLYKGSTIGTVSGGQISESYSLSCEPGYEYNLLLDKALGNFKLILMSPTGEQYTVDSALPEGVSCYQDGFILSGVEGTWNYGVEAGADVPENSVFLIGTGQKPQMPVITLAENNTISFNTDNNLVITGTAVEDGIVDYALKTIDNVVIEENDSLVVANGQFQIELPQMEDGMYSLILSTEDKEGYRSWENNYDLTIDSTLPEIAFSEDYGKYIFRQNITFIGNIRNGSSATVALNGAEVPLVYGYGTGDGIVFSADLNLTNGNNLIVVTAANDFGQTVTKAVTIACDGTVSEEQKTIPIIKRISLENGVIITENTNIVVDVENGGCDDTTLSVQIDETVLPDILPDSAGNFTFILKPAEVGRGTKEVLLTARNKWGYLSTYSFIINIEGGSETIAVNKPEDMTYIQGEILSLQLDSVFTFQDILAYDCNFGEINGTTWTFAPDEIGEYRVILNAYTDNEEALTSFTVQSAVAVSSTITPAAATFNKQAPSDVAVSMTLNGNTLIGLMNGTDPLVEGQDYTISGNDVTISQLYLEVQSIGICHIIFDFSAGDDPVLEVTVKNTSSLLGRWNFDEGIGTKIADTSGNNNNGTIAGATWVNGKVGKALSFDGVNDYVKIPYNSILNPTKAITIEAWINPCSTAADQRILSKSPYPNNDYSMIRASNNRVLVSMKIDGTVQSIYSPANSVPVGTWTHVAGTYDGTRMRLYINGAQVNSFAVCGEIGAHAEPLMIGKNATSAYFKGMVDEVSIYNKALTAAEVLSRYQAAIPVAATVIKAETTIDGKKVLVTFNKDMAALPAAPAGFSVKADGVCNPIQSVKLNTNKAIAEVTLTNTISAGASDIRLSYTAGTVKAADGGVLSSFCNKPVTNKSTVKNTSSLLGRWNFDEGTGTKIADTSGNNNNGTIAGATWVNGKVGKALSFDGVNDYVEIPYNSILNPTKAITIEAWINPCSTAADQRILSKSPYPNNDYSMIRASNNRVLVSMKIDGTVQSIYSPANSVPVGTWTHVAGTYDGTRMRLYINGAQVNSFAVCGEIGAHAEPLMIGKNATSAYFKGMVDEVSIYNKALTAAEVLSRYQAAQ